MAAWLNSSSEASELLTAVKDLLLLGRVADDTEDELDIERWKEQKDRLDDLLGRWTARYWAAGDKPRFFHLLMRDIQGDSFSWDRLWDLAEVGRSKAFDRFRQCLECERWFYAAKDSQACCSDEHRYDYWNRYRKAYPKKRKARELTVEEKKLRNQRRSGNRKFKLR